MLESQYFNQIRKADDFYEIQSISTNHCWVVKKSLLNQSGNILLFHKHSPKDPYYHRQTKRPLSTVKQAVQLIQNHDEYVLSQMTCNTL